MKNRKIVPSGNLKKGQPPKGKMKMKKATCEHCGIELNERVGKNRIICANSGYYYQCDECFNNIESYFSKPRDVRQNNTKNANIFGLEIELDGYEWEVLLPSCKRLEQFGWLPTEDVTVQVEMKTPKYYSLNGLAKTFTQLFKELGSMPSLKAGAHINVSDEQLTRYEWWAIRYYYGEIFGAMFNELKNNRQGCIKLFGRGVDNRWCCEFNPWEHCSTFNMETKKLSSPRIEIRVARISTVEQYMNALKFAGVMMSTIRTNFLNHIEWKEEVSQIDWTNVSHDKFLNYIKNKSKVEDKAQLTGKKLHTKLEKAINN